MMTGARRLAPFVEDRSVQRPCPFSYVGVENAGAFPLALGSQDAALLVWLEPGLYTALVNGDDDSSGISLLEVYEVNWVWDVYHFLIVLGGWYWLFQRASLSKFG